MRPPLKPNRYSVPNEWTLRSLTQSLSLMWQENIRVSAQHPMNAAAHHAFAYEFFGYFDLGHAVFWLAP